MSDKNMPNVFEVLLLYMCIDESDIAKTSDGFFVVKKSIAQILATKNILDFPAENGGMRLCHRFFDDWFLYAVSNEEGYVYSLLKLREQEYDALESLAGDGDSPGVTISFIPFDCSALVACLAYPTIANRSKLNIEINRVVAYKGQRHHQTLKKYFKDPLSCGAYFVADIYTRYIASLSQYGYLSTPKNYKEIVRQSALHKNSAKLTRLPRFIDRLNQAAGRVVCDNEKIYIENREDPTEFEAAAILATHTGNTSLFSFAAEVEYHARFLTALARIKIPFFGNSAYDSAIRADMTVGDTEFQGPAPFYREGSKIVKRQYRAHSDRLKEGNR